MSPETVTEIDPKASTNNRGKLSLKKRLTATVEGTDLRALSANEQLTVYCYAGRLRLLTKRYRRGLQKEFVHNLTTCQYWRESLGRLAQAAYGLERLASSSIDSDRLFYRKLRGLYDEAGDRFFVQPRSDAQAHKAEAIDAIGRAYKYVRAAYWYLEQWQRERRTDAEFRGLLDSQLDCVCESRLAAMSGAENEKFTAKQVDQLVVRSLRNFQQCEQLASGMPPPAAEGENPAVLALQPYMDLCMAGREAFLAEHLLLTLYPSKWQPARHEQFFDLHRRAAAVMPPGSLRAACQYRVKLHKKYLPPSQTSLAVYFKAALEPDYRAGEPTHVTAIVKGAGSGTASPPEVFSDSPRPLERGVVLVVAAADKLPRVRMALAEEILPWHCGIDKDVYDFDPVKPDGELPLPGDVRLIVVALSARDSVESRHALLTSLDQLNPVPLPPSRECRLAVVSKLGLLPADFAGTWHEVVEKDAVKTLRSWFLAGDGVTVDVSLALAERPLTPIVDRACQLLDSWKVLIWEPERERDLTQIIHPLNLYLQQVKSDVIDGARGPRYGNETVSLAEVCRAAFVVAVAAQDQKLNRRGDAGVEVPSDLGDKLEGLIAFPNELSTLKVRGRKGELLAVMILLLTRCVGSWNRPACEAVKVSDSVVAVTVTFTSEELPSYQMSTLWPALKSAGLLKTLPTAQPDSVTLVFQTAS